MWVNKCSKNQQKMEQKLITDKNQKTEHQIGPIYIRWHLFYKQKRRSSTVKLKILQKIPIAERQKNRWNSSLNSQTWHCQWYGSYFSRRKHSPDKWDYWPIELLIQRKGYAKREMHFILSKTEANIQNEKNVDAND